MVYFSERVCRAVSRLAVDDDDGDDGTGTGDDDGVDDDDDDVGTGDDDDDVGVDDSVFANIRCKRDSTPRRFLSIDPL